MEQGVGRLHWQISAWSPLGTGWILMNFLQSPPVVEIAKVFEQICRLCCCCCNQLLLLLLLLMLLLRVQAGQLTRAAFSSAVYCRHPPEQPL